MVCAYSVPLSGICWWNVILNFCVACMYWLDQTQLTGFLLPPLSLIRLLRRWVAPADHPQIMVPPLDPGVVPRGSSPTPKGFGRDALQLQNLWVWIGFALLPAGLGSGFGASGIYYIRDIRSGCVEVSLGVDKTSKGLQCQHACLMTFLVINICGCNRRSGLWILVFFFIMSVYSWKWHPYSPVE